MSALRSLPPAARLDAAEVRKKAAGAKFRDAQRLKLESPESAAKEARDSMMDAVRLYEECYGIFSYLTPRSAAWQNRGIRDDDFNENLFKRQTDGGAKDSEQVGRFLASVLCNYSIVLREEGDVKGARDALEEARALRGDRTIRPTFLLAKLVTETPSSTTVDLEYAVQILSQSTSQLSRDAAQTDDADDALVEGKSLLNRLSQELKGLNQRDRHRFRGVVSALALSSAESVQEHKEARCELGGGILHGTWFEQAEQARRVIAQLRADGDIAHAESLWIDLQHAAALKLFREALVPNRLFDLDGDFPPHVHSLASKMDLELRSERVMRELVRLRDEYYCTEDVDSLFPLDVEMMLISAGLLDAPVLCSRSASALELQSGVIAAQRERLKIHRRSRLGL